MPVLAKEAVKRAGMEKYCKVFITPFRSLTVSIFRITGACTSRAHPVSDAVCGKGIVIPGKFSPFVGYPFKFTVFIVSQSAIARLIFRNSALIHTNITGDSLGVFWRGGGKAAGISAFPVGLYDVWVRFGRFFPYTLKTHSQYF